MILMQVLLPQNLEAEHLSAWLEKSSVNRVDIRCIVTYSESSGQNPILTGEDIQ
jgi:hypothetical protein